MSILTLLPTLFNYEKLNYTPKKLVLNGTVEERVTLLEIQMDEVQGDVAQNEGDISLLFTGEIIQDERLVDLEDDTSKLEQSVES